MTQKESEASIFRKREQSMSLTGQPQWECGILVLRSLKTDRSFFSAVEEKEMTRGASVENEKKENRV